MSGGLPARLPAKAGAPALLLALAALALCATLGGCAAGAGPPGAPATELAFPPDGAASEGAVARVDPDWLLRRVDSGWGAGEPALAAVAEDSAVQVGLKVLEPGAAAELGLPGIVREGDRASVLWRGGRAAALCVSPRPRAAPD